MTLDTTSKIGEAELKGAPTTPIPCYSSSRDLANHIIESGSTIVILNRKIES